MLPFLSVLFGLGLVIWSLYHIRRDIELGNIRLTKGLDGVSDRNLERLIKYLDDLEKSMEEMNQAFYDLVSDLEGEIALNRKEVQLLTERLDSIEGKPISSVQIATLSDLIPRRTEEPQAIKKSNNNFETIEVIPEAPVSINHLSPEAVRQLKVRIVELKKQGLTMNQIAKTLNVGVGELQLFIKLNTK